MSKSTFYIKRGNKTSGPHDLSKVRKLHAASKLRPTDLIAQKEEGPWHKLEDVETKLVRQKQHARPNEDTESDTATINHQEYKKPELENNGKLVHAEKEEADTQSTATTDLSDEARLVDCPDCHTKVSRLAKSCPSCGRPLSASKRSWFSGSSKTTIWLTVTGLALISLSGLSLSLLLQDSAGKYAETIKRTLLDPNSYEHVETRKVPVDSLLAEVLKQAVYVTEIEPHDGSLVRVRFRAATKAGNKTLGDRYFYLNSTGAVIGSHDFSPDSAADQLERELKASVAGVDWNNQLFASQLLKGRREANSKMKKIKFALDTIFDNSTL